MTSRDLSRARERIVACEDCPRLRDYCSRVGREKRRAFLNDTYWARPVPGFGDPLARLLIVGLAPAAHGANRTGRVFTGDGVGGSGDFLMAALQHAGFSNIGTSERPDDGLELTDAFIAAAVRCAPPDNKPTPEEIARCLPHLDAELAALPRVKIVVALGRIGFRRSQSIAYRPACEGCSACVSVRIRCGDFTASRSQKRIMRRGGDVLRKLLHRLVQPGRTSERIGIERGPGWFICCHDAP